MTLIRTDIGVDFIESKPLLLSQGIQLVRPITKISNLRQEYNSVREFGNNKVVAADAGTTFEKGVCSTWQRGDKVCFMDTQEMVEILERGLKRRELMVKIQYLKKSETPGLVVELPLLQLIIFGKLVPGQGDDSEMNFRMPKFGNRLPSSPQPYYRKFSKPIGHGLLHYCYGLGKK